MKEREFIKAEGQTEGRSTELQGENRVPRELEDALAMRAYSPVGCLCWEGRDMRMEGVFAAVSTQIKVSCFVEACADSISC